MNRQPVNPWDWGLRWSMNQGELVEGQVAVRPDPYTEMGIAIDTVVTLFHH